MSNDKLSMCEIARILEIEPESKWDRWKDLVFMISLCFILAIIGTFFIVEYS